MAAGGHYLGLKAILDADRAERAAYDAQPPDACPNDGSPLNLGRSGTRDCPMGDYTWRGGPRLT